MIAGLKPYPKMKDSGVQWLGEVPEHWNAAAVKRHYAIQLGKMLQGRLSGPRDVEVPYLKAQHIQWFAVRTANAPIMWASPRDLEQFGVSVGDLLVCEGGEGGRSGIVREITVGYVIQNALHRVRPLGQCQNSFLQYVMSVIAAAGWFDAINSKATIAHFTREKFSALKMPVPPASEQSAIVRFLDHIDRRIRRYIRAKQKLIKLFEEQKQAIIHRAVTRGLDPNVRFKPSGVEWLGDLPENWEVRPLKYWARINARTLKDRTDPDFTFSYIDIGSVGTGKLLRHPELIAFKNAPSRARRIICMGDTIISTVRTYLKAIYFIEKNEKNLIASTGFAVLSPVGGVLPRFLSIVVQSTNFIVRITTNSVGIAYPAISETRLGCFRLAMPPTSEEQERILRHVDEYVMPYELTICRANREISLLREYRTRLIADVVTGKIDVREAAARLPGEDEKPEPLDEAPVSSEAEEETEVGEEMEE
jgi:type I restriction enzyme S subunit